MRIAYRALRSTPLKIAAAVVAASCLPTWQSTPAAAVPSLKLTASTSLFDDEFNGVAGHLPDSAKWNIDKGYWNAGSRQLQGHLIITALYAPDTTCGATMLNYTSGRLDTNKKFSAQYGTIEIRAKVPTAKGMWSAFWAVGNNSPTVGDPNGGEIDTMEALGSDTGTRKVYGTLHGPNVGSTTAFWSAGGTTTASSDLSAYHIYALAWKPGMISFQLDGKTYYTATRSSLPSNDEWMFDSQQFYMILNLAVGGNWPGNPDIKTTFPKTMTVDWVRVYQPIDAG